MKNTILKITIVFSTLLITFTFSKVNADESMLKKYENLNENQYILYLPSGDFVLNMDGSPNFDQEQIDETGGEVITVREAKERVTSLAPKKTIFKWIRALPCSAIQDSIHLLATLYATDNVPLKLYLVLVGNPPDIFTIHK